MNKRYFGVWPWFIQRITGFLLVIGMVIHFLVLHYVLDKPLTFEKVVTRVRSSPWWIIFDILLLAACVYHGANGIYSIMTDWSMKKSTKKAWGWILSIIGIATFAAGIYIFIPLQLYFDL